MGNLAFTESKDFHWEYTEAPHLSRRVEILKKYPKIKTLMRPNGDRKMVLFGLSLIVLQYFLAYLNYVYINKILPFGFLLNIGIGSLVSSAIFMQMHEAAHGLSFGPNHVWKNIIYGTLLNFGMGFPFFANFKKHHKEHHKYQGEKNVDVEYPYEFELKYFNGPLGKYIWMMLNPVLQTYRSAPTKWAVANLTSMLKSEEKFGVASIIVFDMYLMFTGRFYFFSHIFLGTFVAMTMHMIGLWNVASHVEFFDLEETSCYYGWVNPFMSNFGYHMEHHDFPNIPSRFLPEVRKIAPEYYQDWHHHDSLVSPSIKFIFDPKYGVFSRLKRGTNIPQFANRLLH